MAEVAIYRKKPVDIEAVQWNGTLEEAAYILQWIKLCGGRASHTTNVFKPNLAIETLEGHMFVAPYDWVIKGVAGEFYPCKPDIFEMTYEIVED